MSLGHVAIGASLESLAEEIRDLPGRLPQDVEQARVAASFGSHAMVKITLRFREVRGGALGTAGLLFGRSLFNPFRLLKPFDRLLELCGITRGTGMLLVFCLLGHSWFSRGSGSDRYGFIWQIKI